MKGKIKMLLLLLVLFSQVKAQMTNKIDTVGSIGIGTITPQQKLAVFGKVVSVASGNDYYGAWLDGTSANSLLGLGPWYNQAGYLKWHNNSFPRRLSMYTYNTTDNLTLQESGGNVGIGTTNSVVTLHVKGADGGSISMQNANATTTGIRGNLAWYNSEVSTVALIRAIAITDNVGTELEFYTRPAAGALTRAMIIRPTAGVDLANTLTVQGASTFVGPISGASAGFASAVSASGINLGNMGSLGSLANGTLYIPVAGSGGIAFRSANGATGYGTITGEATGNISFSNSITASAAMFSNNVGIGTTTPSEKLSVNGNIKAQKLIVTQTGWPDYVFHPSYKLKSLSELEQFIQKNNRLPEMPSASEVEEKGISVGDNQVLLLKKMEEMTLYMIEMKKEIDDLKKQNKLLTDKIWERK